jgi:hypothetical protein
MSLERAWLNRVVIRCRATDGLRALPIPQVLILMEGLPGSLLSLGHSNK